MAAVTKLGADGTVWVSKSDLEASMFGGEVPETEQYRRYYGRALTPAMIEATLRAAEFGHMRDLTDLTYETIAIDPHLCSIVGKRFRSLAAMRPKVVPAEGDGIDRDLANYYADVVRQQLRWIPNLPQRILQLDWAHCHGRAGLEKVWRENRGGKVQWRIDELNWIHPRRLSFGPERELRVRDDRFSGYGFEKRGLALRDYPEKFLEFTPQLFNEYPEREGFGPRCLYYGQFKRFGVRERMILLEVFGKPWRIMFVMPDAQVQKEQLDDAKNDVDALGANSSARLAKGIDLKTEQPNKGAGEIHGDVITFCDDQASKLVLGQTRTTDAKADALGGKQAEVMQDEQVLVVSCDGWNIGACLTEELGASVLRMNFGAESLSHCPDITLEFEQPIDRVQETDRAGKAISIGLPLKEDEVYESIGYSRPEPGDRIIQQAPSAGVDPLGMPTSAPAPKVGVMPGENDNDAQGGGAPTGDAAEPAGEQAAPAVPLAAAATARRQRLSLVRPSDS